MYNIMAEKETEKASGLAKGDITSEQDIHYLFFGEFKILGK